MVVRMKELTNGSSQAREVASEVILITEAGLLDDPGPQIVFVNAAFEACTGYARSEVLGRSPRMLQGPGTDRRELDRIRAALEREEGVCAVLVNYRKDGSAYRMELSIEPLRDSAGRVTHFLGVQRVFGAREPQGPPLDGLQEEAQFRALAESLSEAVFVLDPDDRQLPLRILYANAAVQASHGYAPTELIGRSLVELLDAPEMADRARGRVTRILSGETVTFRGRHRHKDGHEFPVEVRGSLMMWRGRRAILGVDVDLSEAEATQQTLRRTQALLRSTGEFAKVGGWELDLVRGEVIWSEQTRAIHEVSDDFVPSLESAIGFYAEHERERLWRMLKRCIDEGVAFDEEFEFVTARGSRRWVQASGLGQRQGGRAVRLYGTFRDITERKAAELARQESESRLKLALESAELGTWDWDLRSGRVVWDANHARLFGIGLTEFSGDFAGFAKFVVEEDLAGIESALAEALQGKGDYAREFRIRRPDGAVRWISGRGRVLRDGSGQPHRMIGIVQDVTERKLAELEAAHAHRRMETLALHDMLTGLASRAAFDEALQAALEGARGSAGLLAVHFLDLDNFKLVNDAYGHAAGDDVLILLADRIRRRVRASDLAARYGGDEFAVIQKGIQRVEDAMALARALLEVIAEPMQVRGAMVQITASIGTSVYPRDGRDGPGLLAAADRAMYAAKHAGRLDRPAGR